MLGRQSEHLPAPFPGRMVEMTDGTEAAPREVGSVMVGSVRTRLWSVVAVLLFGVGAVFVTSSAAQADMPNCGVYPATPSPATSVITFKSTTTCGFTPEAAYAQAKLEGAATKLAPAATSSSGTTTLVSSSSRSCTVSGSYRTYGWGNDIYTNVEERASMYTYISC